MGKIVQDRGVSAHYICLASFYTKTRPVEALRHFEHIAVIHDSFETLDLTENENLEHFFVISKNSWDLKKWRRVPEDTRRKLKLFFLPNIENSSSHFSAQEATELHSRLIAFDKHVEFKIPFGIDLIDSRNPRHLNFGRHLVPCQNSHAPQSEELKISIIIPFCNRSSFVKKVVQSLEYQSFKKSWFEIVLVDDGSSKSNFEELKTWAEAIENIKYIYLPRDEEITQFFTANRAGPARNVGVANSSGPLLLFLDSDILLPKNYLEDIWKLHGEYDVVMPRRVYLKKEASPSDMSFDLRFSQEHVFDPPWSAYINEFYKRGNWQGEELPWKFCITYCLSISRDLFIRTGGFRTNYISFGYEDLDLGVRLMKLNPRLKLFEIDVFHLYHFGKDDEYDLDPDFRFFQLAMSSRMFLFQNLLFQVPYLLSMAKLKTLKQMAIFCSYRLLWGWRRITGQT